MASQLKNILHFTAGGPTSLPHNLNWSGTAVVPDHIELSDPVGVEVEADDTNITISASVDVDILVESWHTIEREFGGGDGNPFDHLDPQPFVIGAGAPTPPFNPTNIRIFARATGSDTTGNGKMIATAYRTWQRAIRDVPSIIPPGVQYYVDCTDLLDGGPEILPPNFAMPAWKAPEGYHGDFSDPFFSVTTAVNMVAVPRLVASLGADATINPGDIIGITQNPVSGQVAIQTNKTFTPGALVGKLLHGSAGFFENAVIYDNDATTIFITLDFPPTAPLQIMEQSCKLVTTWNQVGFSGGLIAANIDSMTFNGFDIQPGTTGLGERGLFQYGGTVWMQGCNLRAPCFTNPMRQANMTFTNLDGDVDGFGNTVTFFEAAPYHGSSRLVNLNLTSFWMYGPQTSWGTNIYGGTVYESCGPVSAIGVTDLFLDHVLIRNAFAEGVRHQSGFFEPFFLGFENCGSNAILVTGGEALLSGAIGGTGWVGAGLKVNGGANVTLQPFGTDAAFTNPLDFMSVGTLADRTFADFRTPATGGFVQQMLDVTAFNATPASFGAAGTGSRVSENP